MFISDRCPVGYKHQKNDQQIVPPIVLFLLHRIADTAMDALAKIGGDRFLAKLATGKLNVGTRHRH
jgi:hypothetical protein